MSAREIFALRRQGRQAEALDLARRTHAGAGEGPPDIWLLRAYAWVLYDRIRQAVDAHEAGRLSPTALHAEISPALREFSRMADPLRRDSAFSQVLRLAGKVSGVWPDFLSFAHWAGIDDFTWDDHKPFVDETGRKLDDLRTRFVRAVCRATVAKAGAEGPEAASVAWGREVLDRALEGAPDDQWLNYYRSRLHLADGETAPASRRLIPVLRRQGRAAWVWGLLGEILEEAGARSDALICLIHATRLAREEQELGQLRIRLARLLALDSRFDEAAEQLRQATRYREQHGYRIPPDLAALCAADWFAAAVPRAPAPVDAEAEALLRGLERANLGYSPGVIDHVNTAKALSYVATGVTSGFVLPHGRFPAIRTLPPGTVVEVGHATADGPAIDWRPSAADTLPGLCERFTGVLDRQEDQAFAFLRSPGGDVFVPPDLAAGIAIGSWPGRSCLAIRRTDKRGRTGWRAVRLWEPGA
ncbi:tetratricopeptide repeat protein [Tistrella mobilis]|uniref:tetratricopeptide repeat protein n=1 Tax=Tistrella mobilis TaxID=171437 RepID=UPI003558B567